MKSIKQKLIKVFKSLSFLIKITLLKHQNKTNLIFMKSTKLRLIKIFKSLSFLIKMTLLKHPNKTNNIFINKYKFKISNFNKYLITIISTLFIYLFYLSFPNVYDKAWVQSEIEKKLIKEFKINFSISPAISYEILPSPHFTIRDVKIFDDNSEKPKELSQIKELKVFIFQNNLFIKENLEIKKVSVNNANFSVQQSDFKFIDNFLNQKFSQKEIKIKKSNLFFKDSFGETVFIIKLFKGNLFFDDLNKVNQILFKGEIFKIPLIYQFNKDIIKQKNNTVINSKGHKLKFENESTKVGKIVNGLNELTIKNLKLISEYKLENNIFSFQNKKKDSINYNILYNGIIKQKPFDLALDIDLEKIRLKKIFDKQIFLYEFLKSGLLFNENLSLNASVKSHKILDNKFFDSLKINFNIKNGKINIDKSYFLSNKIGLLKLDNSRIFLQDDELKFIGDFYFDMNNIKNFFIFFQTPKKIRKPIKSIFFNLGFNFVDNKLIFENFKIDGIQVDEKMSTFLKNFNNESEGISNIFELKKLVNKFLAIYYDG